MQFFYHPDCGQTRIELDHADAHYLLRVRRFKGDKIEFRNLRDRNSYIYGHDGKRTFTLIEVKEGAVSTHSHGIIHLAMIDPKDIYGLLGFLNEINIRVLNIFRARFSQGNRHLDTTRIQRILQYSSMQCGRWDRLEIRKCKDVEEVLAKYPNAVSLQRGARRGISGLKLEDIEDGLIIGPEGGFSQEEEEMLSDRSVHMDAPLILTSHSAVVLAASALKLKSKDSRPTSTHT